MKTFEEYLTEANSNDELSKLMKSLEKETQNKELLASVNAKLTGKKITKETVQSVLISAISDISDTDDKFNIGAAHRIFGGWVNDYFSQ